MSDKKNNCVRSDMYMCTYFAENCLYFEDGGCGECSYTRHIGNNRYECNNRLAINEAKRLEGER